MIIDSHQLQELCAENVRSGKGKAYSKLLHGKSTASQLRAVAINRLPPGSSMGPLRNRRREEIFYILSGSGFVREANDKAEPISAGSCYITKPKEITEIVNTGTEDLIFFAVLLEWRGLF